jgi:hypothetical protein
MPWRIRKAPGKQLYWVVGRDGSHMSKKPIPLSRAKAQMRALYASEREQDMKGGIRVLPLAPDVRLERLRAMRLLVAEIVRMVRQGDRLANVFRDIRLSLRNGEIPLLTEDDVPLLYAEAERIIASGEDVEEETLEDEAVEEEDEIDESDRKEEEDDDYEGADRKEEEDDDYEGKGLGDIVRGVRERVTGVFRGVRRDYTPSARQTIAQFGNGRIVGMSLRRAPIQGYLNKFLNLLTAGAWAKAKTEAKYDNLYHLSLVAMVEMPGQAVVPILIEKNQVINISPTIRMQPGTQFMNVEFEPGTFTLAEFLANGQQAMGDKYFLYDGFYNNCQDFLLGLLRANGIQDVNSERFIKQPLSELIKRLPWYSHVASRGLTDLAAVVDVAVYGRGKKSSEEGETMYGAGRYASVLEAVKGDLIRLRDWEVGKFKPRGSEKFDAESEWEERIINAAAEMAGLPEVPERLTAAQKSAYVRALKRYVALGRSSERRVALPQASAEASVSYAVPVPNSGNAFIIEREARVAREAEAGRTAAAIRAMAAPLSRALDSTTTQVRPMSGYALAAANLPGRWNQYDFGAAADTAAGLDAYAYRRHYDQDAKLEEREDMMEMAEHALDRVESGLVRGNVMLDLRPARSLGSEMAELRRMESAPFAAAPASSGVVSALAGSDEGAMYAELPPLERVEMDAGRAMASAVAASSGAEAVAAPASSAASAAAGLPVMRMSLASASNEQILDLLRSGYGIPDLMTQFNAPSAAVIAKLRRLPGAVTDAEVNALVRGAEDAFNAQRYAEQRAESAAAVRVEADAAAADAGVRAAAAADAPRDEVTGEGKPKLRRPRLKKPTGKVVMDFKDFKGEHTGLIKMLGEAANKLSKEAKDQAGELKTYETNKARRNLMSKKEKEALAGLRRGGAEAAPPKRGRGRPKGSKNKPKGAGFGDILSGIASVGEKLMKPALSNLGKVPGLLPPGGQKAIDAALGVAKSVADTIPARSGDDIIVSSLMGRKRRGRGEPRKAAAIAKMNEALREKPETEAKAAKELEKIHSGKSIREEGRRERIGKVIKLEGKGDAGAFEAQAKRAKMSVEAFADHVLANPSKFQARTRQRAEEAKKKHSPKKGRGKKSREEAK